MVQAFAELVGGWSRRWSARADMAVQSDFTPCANSRLMAMDWQLASGGVGIGMTPGFAASLGIHVLGWDDPGRDAREQQVLGAVAALCLDDLKQGLARWLKLPPDGRWSSGPLPERAYEAVIAAPGSAECLFVVLTTDRFAAAVKQILPAFSPTLGDPAAALSSIGVEMSAYAGRCSLTLAELKELAAGDIVILDRASDEPVPIALDGLTSDRGRCRMTHADGNALLRIVEPLAG